MGEISFLYQSKERMTRSEQAFRYWHTADAIKYSFAYQRYITLSDTSIINSPVAITKVATGLSSLYGLFVTNREPMMPGMLEGFNIFKNPKDTIRNVHEQVKQEGHSMIECLHEPTFVFNNSHKKEVIDPENLKFMNHVFNLNDDFKDDSSLIMAEQTNREYIGNVFKEFWAPDGKIFNVYDDINAYMGRIKANALPIYNAGRPDGITVNWITATIAIPGQNKANILPMFYGTPDEITVNWLKNYMGEKPHIVLNVIANYMAKNHNPGALNRLSNYFGKRPDIIMNHDKEILARGYDYFNMNVYPDRLGERPIYEMGIFNETVSGSMGDKQIIEACNIYAGTKDIYKIHMDDVRGAEGSQKYTEVNNHYSITYSPNVLVLFDPNTFSVREQHYVFMCNGYNAESIIKFMNTHYNVENGIKFDQSIQFGENRMFGVGECKESLADDNGVYAVSFAKSADVSAGVFAGTGGKDVAAHGKSLPVTKYIKSLDNIDIGNIFINKIYNDMGILKSTEFINKEQHKTSKPKQPSFVFKDREGLDIIEGGVDIYKKRLGLGIDLEDVFANKDRKSMSIMSTVTESSKSRHGLMFDEYDLFMKKTSYDFTILNTFAGLSKSPYFAWVDYVQGIGGNINSKNIGYFNSALQLLKECFDAAYYPGVDFAIKEWLPLEYIGNVASKYDGMIIPCSKLRVQGFVDDIDEMVSKYAHKVFIKPNITASSLPKDVAMPNLDLMCDKGGHQAFIDYYNHWLTKQALKVAIFKDEFASKDGHKALYLPQTWAEKESKDIFLFAQETGLKNEIRVSIMEQYNIYKDAHRVNVFDNLFVDKENKVCYYYYDVIAQKSQRYFLIHKDISAERPIREMHKFFDVSAYVPSRIMNWYEPIMFTTRLINEAMLTKEVNIIRESYDLKEFANDYGNWVWAYETPDPFERGIFGIDELLLPENDTRYSDFENIIFDKENMVPRNPVKVINDTTFIAKYPIEHPIEEYADIGKIYEDSAQVFENYLGIETEVMREIFLKYWQIWQSKIFEFATMTMVQSTKKMLDLLYTWITMYYPIDKMEQALRVFRQIRWYSESAIIRNSQYVVSYEYDTLRSNLHTGQCAIPNDMDTNHTMYITSGVIRNNPDYLGQEASVTFEIDTRKNTLFRFSLTNQVGTVKVYVNDNLVAMYPKSGIGYTIELPYTGVTNYVKIVKEANHNIDTNFYIGYIEVPEASFKDLSISFDPVLRAGNKPLDEVAKKLIAFANLHANRNEMYEVARRANVGISETYKKMNEYWKYHHQDNKTKGKRLTIKQL